jgi:F-type H+-transporting ATPase subunit b
MRAIVTAAVAATMAAASPAFAAKGPFFSLGNSDFVVMIAFVLFIGVLAWFKVPAMLSGMLDKRADTIRSQLDEARALREEAQTILAEFERKQKEVQEQADLIVSQARTDAREAAEQAKADLQASIARRLQSAEDQIASAEAGAVRQVRDQAISVAVAAARDFVAKGMTAKDAAGLIEDSIKVVEAKLH